MTRLLWIDRSGWSIPGTEAAGSFWEVDPLTGLADLLARQYADQPLQVVPAPEFYVSLIDEAEPPRPPMDVATEELGLQPGGWRFQRTVRETRQFVLVVSSPFAAQMEALQETYPATLSFAWLPLESPDGPRDQVLAWRDHSLRVTFDEPGSLRKWSWSQAAAPPGAQRLEDWVSEFTGTWWTFEGPATTLWSRLQRTQTILVRSLVAAVVLAAIMWLWSGRATSKLRAEQTAAEQYVAAHSAELQHIDALQERGNTTWSRLYRIQRFSRRNAPVSNWVTELANEAAERHITWQRLDWQENRFTLELEGTDPTTLLDYTDRIRNLAWLRSLAVEELTTESHHSGTSTTAIRLEGVLR